MYDESRLIDLSRAAGRMYFGESLLFADDNHLVRRLTASERIEELEEVGVDVSPPMDYLVDPDWSYVYEVDAEGNVSAPEGYDPDDMSSASMFTADYVGKWHKDNPDGKVLVSYEDPTGEIVVWEVDDGQED